MSRGRGRGRGRGKPYEGLGLPPGEPAPPPILQPPPLYPTLDRRPLELRLSEVEDYLVSIKQDLKQYALKSPYHLTQSDPKSTAIERYSDKYKKNGAKSDDEMGWDIDWNYFPKELGPGRTRRPVKSKVRPKIPGKRKKQSAASSNDTNPADVSPPRRKKRKVSFGDASKGGLLVKKLDSLEQAELSAESEQSAEEENVEEVYDEHDDEEGTDYNLTYFDNGEDYDVGGDNDALEEEAVY